MKFTAWPILLSLILTSCMPDKNTKTTSTGSSSNSSTTTTTTSDNKDQTPATKAPSAPVLNASTMISQSSAVLNWATGSGDAPASYTLSYSINSDLSSPTTINNTSSGKSISGLSANTQYYFKVTATNSMGSATSTTGSFKTAAAVVSVDKTGKFTFTLATSAVTSAGVFQADGTLVRTLWSTTKYSAGAHTKEWDGKDDYGQALTNPLLNYEIKVLSNNVTYDWQGTIGNTSTAQTGSKKLRGYYNCMRGLAITNGYGYYSTGYSEGHSSMHKFKLTAPQAKISLYQNAGITLNVNYVATDGNYVYWGGLDSFSPSNTMVTATKVSDDSEVTFSGGSSYAVTYGMTYKSAINKLNNDNSEITGLAVQKNGAYLFVAHGKLNELHVLNKSTGAFVQKLSMANPRGLAVDLSDNIWVATSTNTVAKYAVNANGTLSAPTLSLAGLVDPISVQISTDGATVVVADSGSSQQLKAYSATNATSSWVYGTLGGYFKDATVKNDKFAFSSALGNEIVFVVFQPDGSFWVNDAGNSRVQHFKSDLTHIETIMSLGSTYHTSVDKNNITRVFAEGLEFKVDYSVPLSGSTGWKLVKNWRTNIGAKYDGFSKLLSPVTLSNGKTYGLVVTTPPKAEIVELPATGQLRFTGKITEGEINKDGSRDSIGNSGSSAVLSNYPLIGFDNSDNPIWNTTATVLATTPPLKTTDPHPASIGLTSTGKVILFNPSTIASYNAQAMPQTYYTGYHLGAINKGANTWLWKTEQSTHLSYEGAFPPAGYFDIGNLVNNYAGGLVNVVNRNIITSYHGEFWKNTQTNKYNHYYDNGLAIGQFGVTRPETSGDAAAMMAGNALTPLVVEASNGDLYLWHGDESDHSAIHLFKISALNTISEQTISIPFPSAYVKPTLNYMDLMAGLAIDKPLASGNGWTRTPASDAVGNPSWEEAWTAKTTAMVYDKINSNDINVGFVSNQAKTATVERDLGTNNVTNSWKISGELSFVNCMPNNQGVQQFLEILDANGKVLSTFYQEISFESNPFMTKLYAGNKIMVEDSDVVLRPKFNNLMNYEISVTNGSVTYKYGEFPTVVAPIVDSTANWKTPKKLRLRFVAKGNGAPAYGANIDLKDLKFYKDQ